MKTFNIGRNATNDIVLEDKMVSRQHAQLIVLDDGQVIIKDLGSSNGTFVNGNKTLESHLRAGDIVKCGSSFLKWTQFVNEAASAKNNAFAERSVEKSVIQSESANDLNNTYSLSETLKYLTTRIFNVGDLFNTRWDRTPSILFFFLTPIVIVLLIGLYFYGQSQSTFLMQKSFSYQVLLPLMISFFIYGVSQFLTISLLSINKETTLVKNIFASSIFSFLQFTILFIIGGTAFVLLKNGSLSSGFIGWQNYSVIVFLAVFTIVMSLTVSLFTFIYQYFRIIGTTNGISIHLTILAVTFNLLLQLVFGYLFISVTFKDLLNF